MKALIHLLVSGIAVFVTAYVLPGVRVDGYISAFVVAVVLAIVNMLVKPVLVILTLPITLLTLGLFMFVVNALIILLVDWLVPGFSVDGIGWAILFSIMLSLVNGLFHSLAHD